MAVRDKLIASTIALVRRKGVAGTGITDLLKHSGIARRSIYLNFPAGKAELVAVATATAGGAITEAIDYLAATPDGPAAAIKTFAALWTDALVNSDFTAGCPIAAAALGRADAPAAADRAGDAFTEWTTTLIEHFTAAGIAPEHAPQLATAVIATIEGALIMAIATQTTTPLHHAEAVLSRILLDAQGDTAAKR